MNKKEKQLFDQFANEDNVGLVLRGLLHVEHQLIRFISCLLPHPERVDWSKIDYTGKVELALSCGLNVDMRPPLEYLEALRNNFACSFDGKIEAQWVLVTYNSLPGKLKASVETAYKTTGKDSASAVRLDTRDLLVFLFISVAGAIQTAYEGMSHSGSPRPAAIKARTTKTNIQARAKARR